MIILACFLCTITRLPASDYAHRKSISMWHCYCSNLDPDNLALWGNPGTTPLCKVLLTLSEVSSVSILFWILITIIEDLGCSFYIFSYFTFSRRRDSWPSYLVHPIVHPAPIKVPDHRRQYKNECMRAWMQDFSLAFLGKGRFHSIVWEILRFL